MRELHGYHGEHRRHGRHAGDAVHGRDATADAPISRAPDVPAHDSRERSAQDALKLRMLTDPAFRTAERLKYQRKEEAAYADYAAKHAKPGDQPGHRAGNRTNEQTPARNANREDNANRGDRPGPPWEPAPRPEHVPPESRESLDKPASKFDKRERSPEVQREDGRKPQRSWLPRADMVKAVTDIGTFATTIAVALGDASAKWEAVAATGAAAVVSNIIWANRHREGDKHGDRPEG